MFKVEGNGKMVFTLLPFYLFTFPDRLSWQ